MTEDQFFKVLNDALKGLPPEEREDILQDFREHFDIGRKEGRSEAEIAESLGPPHVIAKELLAAHHLQKAETKTTAANLLRALWAVIGLSFFNVVFVLGPFLGLLGIWVGGWATGLALIMSPLLVLANAVLLYPGSLPLADLLLDFFLSLALMGLGILVVVGMLYATHALKGFLVGYLRCNAQMVRGGLKHETR